VRCDEPAAISFDILSQEKNLRFVAQKSAAKTGCIAARSAATAAVATGAAPHPDILLAAQPAAYCNDFAKNSPVRLASPLCGLAV